MWGSYPASRDQRPRRLFSHKLFGAHGLPAAPCSLSNPNSATSAECHLHVHLSESLRVFVMSPCTSDIPPNRLTLSLPGSHRGSVCPPGVERVLTGCKVSSRGRPPAAGPRAAGCPELSSSGRPGPGPPDTASRCRGGPALPPGSRRGWPLGHCPCLPVTWAQSLGDSGSRLGTRWGTGALPCGPSSQPDADNEQDMRKHGSLSKRGTWTGPTCPAGPGAERAPGSCVQRVSVVPLPEHQGPRP